MFVHVLIVEDDNLLSRMYHKVLTHAGYLTRRVQTVPQAINAIMSFDPDVICLDWQLEDSTTAPVLEFLESLPPASLPAVLLASGAVREDDSAPYANLIQACLKKPITLDEMVTTVNCLAALRQHREPINHIVAYDLDDGVVHYVWAGHVTVPAIYRSVTPTLTAAHTIIFDIQDVTLQRLRAEDFMGFNGLELSQLERVMVVTTETEHGAVDFLLSFIPPEVLVQSFSNSDDALQAALS